MLAIQTHHLPVAQDLIRLGADPNKQDSAGNTSFMAAVRRVGEVGFGFGLGSACALGK